MGDNRAVSCFRGIDSAAQLHGDARLFHLALDQGAHVPVHAGHGQYAGLPFHNRDPASEGAVDEGQFRSDDAAAHDDDAGGHMIQFQRVVAGQNMRMVNRQGRQIQRR